MADQPIKPPGSITAPADAGNERIAEISNVNRAISNMQQKVNQELAAAQVDVGEFEGIEEVQTSMIKVLNTLNTTVGSLGQGFAKIAAETGRASTDAIKQYGKAIGSDIGLNKQNIIATALAQTSPIFGYFAAKFVETDVFQNAKEKMKTNISNALGGITSKFKESLGIIHKAKAKGEKDKPIKAPAGAVPKMQTGGYVQKEGLAYLHPAEVVVPIDKILGKIDESIDITQQLAKISRRAQLHSLARMGTYVKSVDHLQKVGIFKGFLRAFKEVQEQYQEPSDIRQLRALLAIQDALGAQIGNMQQVWQKMLVEHPTFRQIAFAMKGMATTFSIPFKIAHAAFKARGGWAAHVSRDRNPMRAMAENTGLIYADGMWQLENINRFTRATAEATRDMSSAITGKKYAPLEGIPKGEWSVIGLARTLTNFSTKWISRGLFGKAVSEALTKKRVFTGTKILDFFSERRRLQKETFRNAAELGPVLTPEIAAEAKKKKSIPVVEETLQTLYKEKIKNQQKLLGYTKSIQEISKDEYKETRDINKRQRRKTIFGWLGGLGGSIRNLLGTAMGILSGGIIPWLLGKAVGFMSAFGPKLFTAALNGAIALAKVPELWAVAAAGLIGSKIGQWLDKAIGITAGRSEYLDNMEKLTMKLDKQQTQLTKERFAGARQYSVEGMLNTEQLQIAATLAQTSKERAENVGFMGDRKLFEIQKGQRRYMEEHMAEYLQYGPTQVAALRSEWAKTYSKTATLKEGHLYGSQREADFLKYLKAKGKVRSQEEMAAALTSFKKGRFAQGTLREKGEIAYIEGKELVKTGADKLTAGGRVMKEAVKQGFKEVVAEGKETGQKLDNAIAQSTTVVSNTIQNTASTVNNAAQRARDKFSEYEYAVMKGDYMLEGF